MIPQVNGDSIALVQDTEIGHSQEEEQSDSELGEMEEKELKNSRIKKCIILALLFGFVIFVIVDSTTNQYIKTGIDEFLEWIENNPAPGFFVFVLVYFVATVLFIPGSILTLGAGFVFGSSFGLGVGVAVASLSVFVGASMGAIASFLLGRYLLRDWVKKLTSKYTICEALDVAFREKGFRIMALLRLSPIIPFNAINYIAGVTALSLRNYALALTAILPGTILYVFLGASAGTLTDNASSGDDATVTIIVVVSGVVFGVLAIAFTSYYAKKELNKIVAVRQAQQEAAQGVDGTSGNVC